MIYLDELNLTWDDPVLEAYLFAEKKKEEKEELSTGRKAARPLVTSPRRKEIMVRIWLTTLRDHKPLRMRA